MWAEGFISGYSDILAEEYAQKEQQIKERRYAGVPYPDYLSFAQKLIRETSPNGQFHPDLKNVFKDKSVKRALLETISNQPYKFPELLADDLSKTALYHLLSLRRETSGVNDKSKSLAELRAIQQAYRMMKDDYPDDGAENIKPLQIDIIKGTPTGAVKKCYGVNVAEYYARAEAYKKDKQYLRAAFDFLVFENLMVEHKKHADNAKDRPEWQKTFYAKAVECFYAVGCYELAYDYFKTLEFDLSLRGYVRLMGALAGIQARVSLDAVVYDQSNPLFVLCGGLAQVANDALVNQVIVALRKNGGLENLVKRYCIKDVASLNAVKLRLSRGERININPDHTFTDIGLLIDLLRLLPKERVASLYNDGYEAKEGDAWVAELIDCAELIAVGVGASRTKITDGALPANSNEGSRLRFLNTSATITYEAAKEKIDAGYIAEGKVLLEQCLKLNPYYEPALLLNVMHLESPVKKYDEYKRICSLLPQSVDAAYLRADHTNQSVYTANGVLYRHFLKCYDAAPDPVKAKHQVGYHTALSVLMTYEANMDELGKLFLRFNWKSDNAEIQNSYKTVCKGFHWRFESSTFPPYNFKTLVDQVMKDKNYEALIYLVAAADRRKFVRLYLLSNLEVMHFLNDKLTANKDDPILMLFSEAKCRKELKQGLRINLPLGNEPPKKNGFLKLFSSKKEKQPKSFPLVPMESVDVAAETRPAVVRKGN